MNVLLSLLLLVASLMDYEAIRAALKVAAVSASGLSADGAVEWKGAAPAGVWRPELRCDMSIRSVSGVGDDEDQVVYNPDTDTQDVTQIGQRRFTWTLRFESPDGGDAGFALTYSERFRTRIFRQAILDALQTAAGVAIADLEATQVLENVKLNDRLVSVAVIDVLCNAAENDADDTADVGIIEQVVVESNTLDGEDGTPADNQIDMTVDLT